MHVTSSGSFFFSSMLQGENAASSLDSFVNRKQKLDAVTWNIASL